MRESEQRSHGELNQDVQTSSGCIMTSFSALRGLQLRMLALVELRD
jgi:hypothetical protein